MNKDLRKQYDSFAKDFSLNQEEQDQTNRVEMRRIIGDNLKSKKVLDLACGDGIDAQYYYEQGAKVVGIDASEELIEIATKKYPDVKFLHGFSEELPFEDKSFDVVLCKYAIMTSADMNPVFREVNRILRPGGRFVYLATHPFRQYLELNDLNADYFEQTDVALNCLNGTVIITEPTHTFNDYFNQDFFNKFILVDFYESKDPAMEPRYSNTIPGFFIVDAIKK